MGVQVTVNNTLFTSINGRGVQITYLFIGEALFCKDFQERCSIAVSSFEHLPDDGQEVPDALWLSAPQGPQ